MDLPLTTTTKRLSPPTRQSDAAKDWFAGEISSILASPRGQSR